MLRSLLSLAIVVGFPVAAAAHTSLVPHDHPHGPSFMLSAEVALLALAGAGVFVLATRALARLKKAPRPVRRAK